MMWSGNTAGVRFKAIPEEKSLQTCESGGEEFPGMETLFGVTENGTSLAYSGNRKSPSGWGRGH